MFLKDKKEGKELEKGEEKVNIPLDALGNDLGRPCKFRPVETGKPVTCENFVDKKKRTRRRPKDGNQEKLVIVIH